MLAMTSPPHAVEKQIFKVTDANELEEKDAITHKFIKQQKMQLPNGELRIIEIPQYNKYPLEHVWTLWYLENDRSKLWREMQNEITNFDTVEDFWSLYYTIKPPSELRVGCDYSMFKRGTKPMWEDSGNKEGGRWLVTVNKSSKVILDKFWLDIMLMMVGESFEHPKDICGAVVNIRAKSNKISVWTSDATDTEAILEIGHKLKLVLHLPANNLQYQLHADSMSKQGSTVRSIFTI